jgi:Rrf2 family iron-sulfur cluster assembly transcriptional regulator
MLSKATRLSISAMSALAEVHGTDSPTLTSTEIAKRRGIPSPFVAKVMTMLSLRGLVSGTRGPGGGYSLARPPGEITLFDIASVFQRIEEPECPLGRAHVCSDRNACGLHVPLRQMQASIRSFLTGATLAGFATGKSVAAANTTVQQRKSRTRRAS